MYKSMHIPQCNLRLQSNEYTLLEASQSIILCLTRTTFQKSVNCFFVLCIYASGYAALIPENLVHVKIRTGSKYEYFENKQYGRFPASLEL